MKKHVNNVKKQLIRSRRTFDTFFKQQQSTIAIATR
jgi:hypothetical protein